MSGWRRCDRCRKVRTTDEFDGEATTCSACLTAPVPAAPRKRATTVTRSQTAPRPPAPAASVEPAVRRPLLGSIGSGDLEVRERRARRAAVEALAESHAEEFALLLRDARAKEGLRPLSNGTTPTTDDALPAEAPPADAMAPADGD